MSRPLSELLDKIEGNAIVAKRINAGKGVLKAHKPRTKPLAEDEYSKLDCVGTNGCKTASETIHKI